MSHTLGLHEEILLLALRDEEGTTAGDQYAYGLAGAIAAELLLRGRIRLVEGKRKPMVEALETAPAEDVLGTCQARIAVARRRATLATWVQRLAAMRNLKHMVAQELCRRGVLRADEDKVLLLFKRKIYPEVDPGPERELTDRLREAIVGDAAEVDPRTVLLISLASSAGLLGNAFSRKELRARKKRIDAVVNGEVTGQATREAIEAAQAAMVAATIIPSIAATTVISH